jgi:NAD(P)-dependent dehydrogenase (short-subunit alcohol dehydrogenase family)
VLTIRQSTSETVALISGGNRGLGRETARQLAAKGMKVVIGSRDLEAGQVTARELSVHGVVAAVELDVTDEASACAAIEFVAARFDGLDVLVNNAGRIVEEAAVSTTAEQLQDVFATNVFGAATMIRLALPMSPAPRRRASSMSQAQRDPYRSPPPGPTSAATPTYASRTRRPRPR